DRITVRSVPECPGPEAEDAGAIDHPGRIVDLVPAGLEPLVGHLETEHQPDDRGFRALKQELGDGRILDEQVALTIESVPHGEHGIPSCGAGPAGAPDRTWPGARRRLASQR